MNLASLGGRLATVTGISLLAFLASQCGKEPCAFGPGQCEGGSTGDAGTGGAGAAGGDETGGMGGVGGDPTGGQGGAGGDPTTTTSTTTTTTSTTSTGGAGGAGGGLPVGCDPPSPYGANCAESVCGVLPDYYPGPECGKSCVDDADDHGISPVPAEYSWVLTDFAEDVTCVNKGCSWSFVLRVHGKGCARATVSDGLFVSRIYGPTVCGPGGNATCAYEDGTNVSGEDIRFIVTVDPDNVPAAGWLRLETIPDACPGSGFGCL